MPEDYFLQFSKIKILDAEIWMKFQIADYNFYQFEQNQIAIKTLEDRNNAPV